MSTAPTPGPTAPQPDRPTDPRLDDGIFGIHIQNARRDTSVVRQWRNEVEDVINTVDTGAAVGRSREMTEHGVNDIEAITEIAGMVAALGTWIRVNHANFSDVWNSEGPGGISASDAIFEINQRLQTMSAQLGDHGCWEASRDGQPSVMTRVRGLRAVIQQFANLPVIGNSAASVQIVTGVHGAIDEVRVAMEAEYNRRPTAPSAEGARTLTEAVAARYMGIRQNLSQVLNTIARREFWEERGLSLEDTTVAQIARQLVAELDTRIQLVPGAAANTVRVTDPNAILIALNRLVERMDRECEMRRPPNATMRRDTPEHDQYRSNVRRFRAWVAGAVLLVLGGGGVGTYLYTASDGKPAEGTKAATAAVKPAPAPTSVLKLPQGCTIERKGNRIVLIVPPGNGAANVFVSQNGSPSQKVGNQLEAGTHSMFLPAGTQQNLAIKVTVQIWDGDKWLPNHDVLVP